MGFPISWAVLRIPKPRIPDSTSKNDQDSRIRPIPLRGATFDFTNFIDTFLYHQLRREQGLLPRHYLTIWSQRQINSFNRIMLSVSIKTARRSILKIRIFRGVARIFQEGGGGGGEGGSRCVTPRVLTRLACRHSGGFLLKGTFFSMSSGRGKKEKPTR